MVSFYEGEKERGREKERTRERKRRKEREKEIAILHDIVLAKNFPMIKIINDLEDFSLNREDYFISPTNLTKNFWNSGILLPFTDSDFTDWKLQKHLKIHFSGHMSLSFSTLLIHSKQWESIKTLLMPKAKSMLFCTNSSMAHLG